MGAKQTVILIILSGFTYGCLAQKKNPSVAKSKLKQALDCQYINKYPAIERNKFYPFNVADSIKLISFRHQKNNYPIKGNTLIEDSIIEMKALTRSDIEELTDIQFNNFYFKKTNYGMISQCFLPRNAILFLDKSGDLLESVLLCFHCSGYQKSNEQIEFGADCSQKSALLRQYFLSKGIKFGTDMSIERYPGEINYDDSIFSKL
jgi:hypothetical protein